MPTYKVTDPNTGRVLRLTGDSPPTQQELEGIFSQYQVDQQPVIDPNVMVDSPRNMRQQMLEQQASGMSIPETAAVGFGRGLTTIGRGLGLVGPEEDIEKRAFETLESYRPITTTVSEVAGEAAPFVVAGTPIGAAATIPARVGLTGLLGATEAATIAKGKGANADETIMAGGAGGAIAAGAEVAFPIIGRLGGRLIRKLTGKAPSTPVLDASGNPSVELAKAMEASGLTLDDLQQQALKQVNVDDVTDPEALIRKQFLEDQGIAPTRAQVTGQKSDFQTQQELAKTSGRIDEALMQQEQILGDKFENAVTATGGTANPSKSPVVDFIADKSITLDAAISDAYKTARASAPTEQVVRPDSLIEAMRSIAGSEKVTGGIVGATRDILKNKGLLGKKGLEIKGRVTPQVAEEIRIEMNGLYDSLSPMGRKSLRDFKNALDNDVANAVGEDVFKDARAAKAKFERDLSRSKVNKFDRRNKEIVRDILENKIDPDRFLDQAVLSKSVRADDIKQLETFLKLDGNEAGLQAWNDLRAEALERIKTDAFREVGGDAVITRAQLERAINRFGDAKLKALFTKEENRFLQDMLKVTKIREPKRGTAQGMGPTAQAVLKLEEVVKRIPLIGNTFEGLAVDQMGRVVIKSPSLKAPLKPIEGTAQLVAPLAGAAGVALTAQEQ